MTYLIVEYPAENDLFQTVRDVFNLEQWKIAKVFLPEHKIIEVHKDGKFYENDRFSKSKNWRAKYE